MSITLTLRRIGLFALFALTTASRAPADEPTIGTVCTIPVISASLAVGSTGKDTKRLVYSPPPGWYIRSHRLVCERKHGIISYAVSTVPAGWSWMNDQRSAAANRTTGTAIVAAYKAWAGGRAEGTQDATASGRQMNSASHHAILLEVSAKGEGLLIGGAGVDVTVYAEMVYVGKAKTAPPAATLATAH